MLRGRRAGDDCVGAAEVRAVAWEEGVKAAE